MADFGMPKFSIKTRWIIVAILLPVIVKAIYIFLFAGEYISSGMNNSEIFSTLSAGIVFTGIAAGFVEEMVFRGFILNLLKSRWNTLVAVLVLFFASTFWTKLQNIFGHCCMSKLDKVAKATASILVTG